MARKTSAFGAAGAVTATTEFLVRQDGNKRLSRSALQTFIESLLPAAGEDGREVELQASATHIQWRYTGDSAWTNLVALSAITGPDGPDGEDGADGREVQLQKTATHIQWRYAGDATWTDLVALVDLTGPAGTGLTNRGAWVSGADYSAGDYVFAAGTNGNSMFICQSAETFTSITEPLSDSTNWVEFTAPAGADGREIELQASGTAIQWRYSGDSTWTDLVPLSELKGADGVGIPTGGTAGQFLAKASSEDHDAEWVDAPPGGGSSTLIGVLAANSANQETTIAELVNVAVETGSVYQFRFLAEVKPTSTSIGLKWGFTGSFGAQFIQALASYRESASGPTQKALRTKADIATFASSEAGNDGNLIEIKGLVHVITGGTFGIGYAVSTQYDYAGVTRGASLVLEPIGAVSLT